MSREIRVLSWFIYLVVGLSLLYSFQGIFYNFIPASFWIEYGSVTPAKQQVKVNERLYFVSEIKVNREVDLEYHDVLFCNFWDQGFIRYSEYTTTAHNVEPYEMKEVIWPYIRLHNDPNGYKYESLKEFTYQSSLFQKQVTVPKGYRSDGASGAWDIRSDAWWVHDVLCETGKWDDGTLVSNFVASTVLGNILWYDGYTYRSVYWWWATFFFGGGQARKNGMWRVGKGKTN